MRNKSNRIGHWFVVSMALLLGMSRIEGLRGGQSGPAAARTLYQQALHEEDATGNLKAAIAFYERVLAAKPDRTLAAQALIVVGSADTLTIATGNVKHFARLGIDARPWEATT